MRLAFASTIQGVCWAGSEELWYATAMRALNLGHDIACLVHRPVDESTQIDELRRQGVTIFRRVATGHPRVRSIREKFVSSLQRLIRWNPDVVLVSLGSPLDLCYWAECSHFLLDSSTRFILILQFNADSISFAAEQREQCQKLFSRANSVVFVSQHNRDLLRRQLAMEFGRHQVIYNPIRLIAEAPLAHPQGKTTFGCVARLETRWKGQDVLLECLSQQQWHYRDWKLNFYGTGPDEIYIRRLIKHYDLADRVTMCGYVRDMQKVWSGCHVKVLASHGEGTPLAVLEAMMCGRTVITTDAGGNHEVLVDGQTGFIADAATPRAFGQTLESAWQQRGHWSAMGAAAHQDAKLLSEDDPAGRLLDMAIKET